MLLVVFGLLLGLTLVFFFLGQYMDAPFFKIAGGTFLFLLGLLVMFGSLSIPTGLSETVDYSYTDGNLSQTNTTTTYHYTNISTDIVNNIDFFHLFGLLFCVIGVFAFINSFVEIRPPKEVS